MSLEESFSNIPDPRRKQGQRFSLPQLLTMMVLSYMCGYGGYRGTATFCRVHSDVLREDLGLPHGTPSHDTFWSILRKIPHDALIRAFCSWAMSLSGDLKGAWVCADGKALGSTVADCHGSGQSFSAIVSLFVRQSQLAIALASYHNGKKAEGEGKAFRELLSVLKGQGVIFTADALHIQKKR